MTRPHPFDLLFVALADTGFPEIADEATRLGRDSRDLPQFATLPSAQRLLEEFTDPEIRRATPEGAQEYVILLYALFSFWSAGAQTREVERTRLQELFDRPLGGLSGRPNDAAYLRFPDGWFWARVNAQSPAEPLDGIFVVPSPRSEIIALAVLGLRSERAGFSQIAATATWSEIADASGLIGPPLFDSVLPGGHEAGLRSVTTLAELLHLIHLALLAASR